MRSKKPTGKLHFDIILIRQVSFCNGVWTEQKIQACGKMQQMISFVGMVNG
jgi:hypothetical protein